MDEYQRLPGVVLALLRHRTARLILSGDPAQSFTTHDLAAGLPDLDPVELSTSLRLPEAVGAWIDHWWSSHGLEPPQIACAAGGGRVVEVEALPEPVPDDAQVIAAAAAVRAARRNAAPPDADASAAAQRAAASGTEPASGTGSTGDDGSRDWLSPLDALGLEWPHVVLVDPDGIRSEHGDAGLFVAATRAIDRLTVVGDSDRSRT